jgi:RNA polymerase sporulation-specific sigma factor
MEVVDLYIAGITYSQIAEILERTPKSVDNAIQRIRSKLSAILTNK